MAYTPEILEFHHRIFYLDGYEALLFRVMSCLPFCHDIFQLESGAPLIKVSAKNVLHFL